MKTVAKHSNGRGHGHFEIISLENGTEVWRSGVQKNLILDAYLENIVAHLNGDTTYPLEITSIEIGTGTNAVTAADTALQTPVLTGEIPAKVTVTGKSILFEFFIVDANLADGTYTELGLRAGSILATRALFGTPYEKVSGRDTIIRYTLSLDAA